MASYAERCRLRREADARRLEAVRRVVRARGDGHAAGAAARRERAARPGPRRHGGGVPRPRRRLDRRLPGVHGYTRRGRHEERCVGRPCAARGPRAPRARALGAARLREHLCTGGEPPGRDEARPRQGLRPRRPSRAQGRTEPRVRGPGATAGPVSSSATACDFQRRRPSTTPSPTRRSPAARWTSSTSTRPTRRSRAST